MSEVAKASWNATEVRRKVLAFAFCLDSIGVVDIAYRAGEARPERLGQIEGFFGVLAENLWLRVLIGLVAIGASVFFSWKPGRAGAALLALAATGINYTFCAEFTGSVPNVLVCTGLAMIAWAFTIISARVCWPPESRPADFLAQVERLAGYAALAAFGIYFMKAGLSKYFNSGWDWADGSKIRSLMLMYAYSPDSVIGSVQEIIVNSAALSRLLATVTLFAQLGAIVFPFTRRGRIFVGTVLLGFELSVYFIAGIFAPGNIALIIGFTYPWHRLGASGRGGDDEHTAVDLPPPSASRVWQVGAAFAAVAITLWYVPFTPVSLGTPKDQMAGGGQGERVHQHQERERQERQRREEQAQEQASSEEEPPVPEPVRKPPVMEYVVEGSQQARIQSLLRDVGFNRTLKGDYRFSRIAIKRTSIRFDLSKSDQPDVVAGSLTLHHVSKVSEGQRRSKSFAFEPTVQSDGVVTDHLNAAIESVSAHDEGGYFMKVERAPEVD